MIAYLSTTGGLTRCTVAILGEREVVIVTREPLMSGDKAGLTWAGEDGVEVTARCSVRVGTGTVFRLDIVAWQMDEDAPLRGVASERVVH